MAKKTLRSYAETKISPAQSRQDIQELLAKAGATGFRWTQGVGFPGSETLEVGMEFEGRSFAFRLVVRFENEDEWKRRMRGLFWYLKTKIEAVQMGLVDVQQEFLAHLLTGPPAKPHTVWEELGETKMKLLTAGSKAGE